MFRTLKWMQPLWDAAGAGGAAAGATGTSGSPAGGGSVAAGGTAGATGTNGASGVAASAGGSGDAAASGAAKSGDQAAASSRGLGAMLNAATGAGAAAGGASGQTGDAAQRPDWLPDNFPEAFKADTARATIEKMLGQIPKVPEKPDGYTWTPSTEFTRKHGDLKGDPVLDIARKTLHAAGLAEGMFTTVVEQFYAQLETQGLLMPTVDSDAIMRDLMKEFRGPPDGMKRAYVARLTDLQSRIASAVSAGTLAQAEGDVLQAMTIDANGVRALEKLLAQSGDRALHTGGQPAAGGATKADLEARMQDPRYDTRSNKFDQRFRTAVDKAWQELHGAR